MAGDVQGGEDAGGLVECVGVGVAVFVVVEADGGAVVVDAQELVDRSGDVGGLWVGVAGEGAVPFDEAAVGAVGVDPEAGRVAFVVQAGDLGLLRAGEVLADVVVLLVGRVEQVALVGVPGDAAAEVAGDDPAAVDAEKLVERGVGLVVQGGEGVAGGRWGSRRVGGRRVITTV